MTTRGSNIQIETKGGHVLGAYRTEPAGAPRGGVVVLQELFGVNRHIRSICEDFAAEGYVALAPRLFDRIHRNLELGYDSQAIQTGLSIRDRIPLDDVLHDVQSAVDHLEPAGQVGVVGYCWGGTLAFLAAARLARLGAAVGYYGSMIPQFAAEAPTQPLMLHFGAADHTLPPEQVDRVRQLRPETDILVYEAGHGFNCDERANYAAESAALARQRTLDFFDARIARS